jgi:hypothetical protein
MADTDRLLELAEQVEVLNANRLQLDRESKKLKVEEDNARALLIQEMAAHGFSSVDLGHFSITVSQLQKPFVMDWGQLETYIRENAALDLLQRRLTESAVKLRWDDGVVVPGVGLQTVDKVLVKRGK